MFSGKLLRRTIRNFNWLKRESLELTHLYLLYLLIDIDKLPPKIHYLFKESILLNLKSLNMAYLNPTIQFILVLRQRPVKPKTIIVADSVNLLRICHLQKPLKKTAWISALFWWMEAKWHMDLNFSSKKEGSWNYLWTVTKGIWLGITGLEKWPTNTASGIKTPNCFSLFLWTHIRVACLGNQSRNKCGCDRLIINLQKISFRYWCIP